MTRFYAEWPMASHEEVFVDIVKYRHWRHVTHEDETCQSTVGGWFCTNGRGHRGPHLATWARDTLREPLRAMWANPYDFWTTRQILPSGMFRQHIKVLPVLPAGPRQYAGHAFDRTANRHQVILRGNRLVWEWNGFVYGQLMLEAMLRLPGLVHTTEPIFKGW